MENTQEGLVKVRYLLLTIVIFTAVVLTGCIFRFTVIPGEGAVPGMPAGESAAVEATSADAGSVIDNFDTGYNDDATLQDKWYVFMDTGPDTKCNLLLEKADIVSGDTALNVSFDVEKYAGFGKELGLKNWSDFQGISFSVKTFGDAQSVIPTIYISDPSQDNPDSRGMTPYEISIDLPIDTADDFVKVVVPFKAFEKSSWVGDGGANRFDASQVLKIEFVLAEGTRGSLIIDDVNLMKVSQGKKVYFESAYSMLNNADESDDDWGTDEAESDDYYDDDRKNDNDNYNRRDNDSYNDNYDDRGGDDGWDY